MTTGFDTYLRTGTNLNDADIEQIVLAAKPLSLQRGEALLQHGQICRHKTFIVNGLLRIYGFGADGSEHILYFAPENNWAVEPESYHQQSPSQFTIAAVERSEVLVWTKPDFDRLLQHIPELTVLSEQLINRSHINNRQRLFSTLSATAEEKYEDFVRSFPDLLPRLPLHMIAAYLGISLKTLTRIRHAQVRR
ncbi:cyclic nucleotide-binding protein [Niastella yeongjuensis]|uniref:Cyclic nucleotide-binding protein n=1 Tax=Niastella yeongjuensis TaxID=354355 RepID=A0A1V9EF69_9BACT|nr:Crp/Fnr family transcriptional regulator [Niastella yeongjuensis]OQP44778.1 cyclic nucleotide-binding protein [Niastella yeongjuensis]SEP42482.1 cAMP-binding domain of CRP or a regulatory subunit of cAMP-dependent protein kinases [Niastella yeongjuensis]